MKEQEKDKTLGTSETPNASEMPEASETLENLIKAIWRYEPRTDKETWEKQQILCFMEKNPDCLLRSNRIAHLTASAWVVNPARTKVIMAYHRIYDSWAWLGGHADGEADLLKVALKEAEEECGLAAQSLKPVSQEIFSLETLTVDGHVKRGSWVPSHLHLNLTYLIEADDTLPLHHKDDENTSVRWFGLDEALAASTEPWMVEHVYKKLVERTRRIQASSSSPSSAS